MRHDPIVQYSATLYFNLRAKISYLDATVAITTFHKQILRPSRKLRYSVQIVKRNVLYINVNDPVLM
jgi:hypothetical protein